MRIFVGRDGWEHSLFIYRVHYIVAVNILCEIWRNYKLTNMRGFLSIYECVYRNSTCCVSWLKHNIIFEIPLCGNNATVCMNRGIRISCYKMCVKKNNNFRLSNFKNNSILLFFPRFAYFYNETAETWSSDHPVIYIRIHIIYFILFDRSSRGQEWFRYSAAQRFNENVGKYVQTADRCFSRYTKCNRSIWLMLSLFFSTSYF